LDKDEIVSRMKVWQLDDRNHWSLLAKLIPAADLTSAVFVITVDLSKPWEVLSSLEKWLDVVKQTTEKIASQLPSEQQAAMKKKISHYVQTYMESTEKKVEIGEPEAAEAKAAVIDEAVPKVNFGIPVVIVGTKGDYYSRVIAKTSADEKFEHVVRRLRAVALEHGAGLVFTSAFGEGANVQVLQDYIYTRALGLPQNHPAKIVGVASDYGIFVPAGFDNAQLLATKVSGRSGWTDATPMTEIFTESNEAKKAKPDPSKDALVTAEDNESFFKNLREQLNKGVPFTKSEGSGVAPPPPPPNAGKKQMVTSFFNNLLKT
jgi:dynein light intermediate chain 1